MKRALITGITGQDGSYLAELLLEKGYRVYGLVRRASSSNLERILHLCNDPLLKGRFSLVDGDLGDSSSLKRAIKTVDPHEVYNLAAMSHVRTSFEMPEYAADVNGIGVLRLLETINSHNPRIRFYQASTSELYGKVQEIPQTEKTPFYPRSPYGVAKLYAYWTVVNYREAYGLFACNGILFNHESPRRGEHFVSRKITKAAVAILRGKQEKLLLGNLDAKRDWGFAKDYVEGMWLMLQKERPDDYVLATGRTTTVRHFVEMVFSELNIPIVWQGSGIDEKGMDQSSGRTLIEISSELFRPTEVDLLIGNPMKAKRELGWEPSTTIQELAKLMVQADLRAADRECFV